MHYDMDDIRRANRRAGFHWFDRDTMRCFGTRLSRTVYNGPGGVFFVTSEQPPYGRREYTVRVFSPATGSVRTVGRTVGMYRAAAAARRVAIRCAADKCAADLIDARG